MDVFVAVDKNPFREPSRIQNVLGALSKLWQQQNDFGVMELVSNAHSSMAEFGLESTSIWNTEDDVWLTLLQRQKIAEDSFCVPLYHQEVLSQLSDVWTRFPEMRFGQLLWNICSSHLESREFNTITDLELLEGLSSYAERTRNLVLMMVSLTELIPPSDTGTQEP